MLYSDPILYFKGLTIFKDFSDPKTFYYLPPEAPRIARSAEGGESGDYALRLVLFRPDPNAPLPAGMEDGGGFLNLDTDLHIGAGVLDQVREEIRRKFGTDANLVPVPFMDGSVELVLLGVNRDEEGQPFVREVAGSTVPSLYGTQRAAFSTVLDRNGAALMKAVLEEGGVTMALAIYHLTYAGIPPAYNLKITIDYQRVFDHLDLRVNAGVSAKNKTSSFVAKAGFHMLMEELKETKAIKVEEVDPVPGENGRTPTNQEMINEIIGNLMGSKWFKPTLSNAGSMTDLTGFASGGAAGASGTETSGSGTAPGPGPAAAQTVVRGQLRRDPPGPAGQGQPESILRGHLERTGGGQQTAAPGQRQNAQWKEDSKAPAQFPADRGIELPFQAAASGSQETLVIRGSGATAKAGPRADALEPKTIEGNRLRLEVAEGATQHVEFKWPAVTAAAGERRPAVWTPAPTEGPAEQRGVDFQASASGTGETLVIRGESATAKVGSSPTALQTVVAQGNRLAVDVPAGETRHVEITWPGGTTGPADKDATTVQASFEVNLEMIQQEERVLATYELSTRKARTHPVHPQGQLILDAIDPGKYIIEADGAIEFFQWLEVNASTTADWALDGIHSIQIQLRYAPNGAGGFQRTNEIMLTPAEDKGSWKSGVLHENADDRLPVVYWYEYKVTVNYTQDVALGSQQGAVSSVGNSKADPDGWIRSDARNLVIHPRDITPAMTVNVATGVMQYDLLARAQLALTYGPYRQNLELSAEAPEHRLVIRPEPELQSAPLRTEGMLFYKDRAQVPLPPQEWKPQELIVINEPRENILRVRVILADPADEYERVAVRLRYEHGDRVVEQPLELKDHAEIKEWAVRLEDPNERNWRYEATLIKNSGDIDSIPWRDGKNEQIILGVQAVDVIPVQVTWLMPLPAGDLVAVKIDLLYEDETNEVRWSRSELIRQGHSGTFAWPIAIKDERNKTYRYKVTEFRQTVKEGPWQESDAQMLVLLPGS